MIKGCHKRIIFLKNTGNELFDEAYFILKPQAFSKKESDVVQEATKIVNGINEKSIKPKRDKDRLRNFIFFSIGVTLGVITTVLIHIW